MVRVAAWPAAVKAVTVRRPLATGRVAAAPATVVGATVVRVAVFGRALSSGTPRPEPSRGPSLPNAPPLGPLPLGPLPFGPLPSTAVVRVALAGAAAPTLVTERSAVGPLPLGLLPSGPLSSGSPSRGRRADPPCRALRRPGRRRRRHRHRRRPRRREAGRREAGSCHRTHGKRSRSRRETAPRRPASWAPCFSSCGRTVRARAWQHPGADPRGGGNPVEQVKVSRGPVLVRSAVHSGNASRFLVRERAGADAGLGGEGLVGGQLAPGQRRRPGLLAEHLHPRPGPLRVLLAAGGGVRVDGDRRPRGEPGHLPVGLAREISQDHRFRRRGVLARQLSQRLVYRLRLAVVSAPAARSPPIPGSRASRTHASHISRSAETAGIARASATSWVSDFVQPAGRITVIGTAGQRLVVVPDQRPQDPELGGGRPRFERLPLAQQPEHLLPRCSRAPPPGPGRGLQDCRQRRRRRARVPLPAPGEPGKVRAATRDAAGQAGSGPGDAPPGPFPQPACSAMSDPSFE